MSALHPTGDTAPVITSAAPTGRLRTFDLVSAQIGASSPLIVLAGAVTAALAISGSLAAPLVYLLVGLGALLPAALSIARIAHRLPGPGAFYRYATAGLGRTPGLVAAALALLSYNAVQIALYGLLGATLADLTGLPAPWWVWAGAALVAVGALGLADIQVSVRVVQVALAAEVIAVGALIGRAILAPADGRSIVGYAFEVWSPTVLATGGLGVLVAFAIASFEGFELSPAFAGDAANPARTVPRALVIALTTVAIGYAAAAWALIIVVGPTTVIAAAAQGPALVFSLFGRWGPAVAVVFVASVFAAMLAFHSVIARYLAALGDDAEAPTLFAARNRRGAPVVGSAAQTVVALLVVAAFVLTGADPVLGLFTWSSGVAAVSFVTLLVLACAAVIGYHRAHPCVPGMVAVPVWATLALLALLVVLVGNFDALIGGDGPLRWALPGLTLVAIVGGIGWARLWRRYAARAAQ